MRIAPEVYLVGSGWLGFGLTDRHDSHVYLIGDADGAVLIDAGCGLAGDAIMQNIARCGVPPEAVTTILITHAHADHAAGAAELAARLGAQVMADNITVAILRAADEDAAGLVAARAAQVYPPTVKLHPVDAIELNGPLHAGGWTIEALATPGHAAGHLAFLATQGGVTQGGVTQGGATRDGVTQGGARLLFSGDLVFSRGRVAVLATPDTDIQSIKLSIESVAARRPTSLLPGHGELVLGSASEHLAVALHAFTLQQLPEGLI